MGQHYLRTYKPFVLEEVKKNLLIIGDLTGNCASCTEPDEPPVIAADERAYTWLDCGVPANPGMVNDVGPTL